MLKRKNIYNHQEGLTLVELVVSLTLLIAAVLASSRLINVAARSANEAGRRVQATFLADREFEIIRNIRDGNILSGRDAWVNLNLPQTAGRDCVWFVMTNAGSVDAPLWQVDPIASVNDSRAFNIPNDKFSVNESDQLYETFTRTVEMCEEPSNVPGGGGYDTDVRRVRIIVRWQEASGPERTVEVSNFLTNWSQTI